MQRRPRTASLVFTAAMAAIILAPSVGVALQTSDTDIASRTGANRRTSWEGRVRKVGMPEERAASPEDRYAMAGGCYVIRAENGAYVARSSDGFATSAADARAAEPFFFQATDLGSYLLYGTAQDFLAASEGAVGDAAYGATRSQPGQVAGGLTLEQTDAAADAAARSEANRASGRGESVVAAAQPSNLADWDVRETASMRFSITLPETDQALIVGEGGVLDLVDGADGDAFRLQLAEGCAAYPEIEVNVDGPILGGQTRFQETRGYFDAHLHMMAFEFLGGRARCGRPWHRFGAPIALKDCPDHEPGGRGAVLEDILTRRNPGSGHNTDGWPSFTGWPTHYSLTHEQIYYKWLERAWRGGLRMFTNLLVDNNQLCKLYPYKRHTCNEMDGVRLQAQRIRQLERYIDAQNGGPGEGWFRIVDDPFEAREVINQGKLAVVLGIEVSVPLDCGLTWHTPTCSLEDIEPRLDEVYDLGVRQMELVNKFDNAFSGVAGDSGTTGVVVNHGNKLETGRYWQMDTCDPHANHGHDKTQMNIQDDGGTPPELTGRDALAGGVLALAGTSGVAPLYPEGPHCNQLGLSELGETMIREMVERGMMFDPDHMSALAQTQALDLLEELDHPGIVSSHGWSNNTIYPRVYELGGIVTPYAGNSTSFVNEWRKHVAWADERYYFGFGYGADTNGFGSQGGPRGADAENPVEYPFTGFGGVTVDRQQSGTRPQPYDINVDGVAHYGLYPDWIEDLRRLAGDAIIEDMQRGPEAYLQMWERTIGIAPDSCRSDVADLATNADRSLRKNMSYEDVLRTLGQPSSRSATAFTYCVSGGRTLRVEFKQDGRVAGWRTTR